MANIIKERTEYGKHYWNNEGRFDQEFTELTNRLMPAVGRGESLMDDIRNFIESHAGECGSNYFSDGNMHRYDHMIDLVYVWCVANEEREKEEIPTWYTNK